MIYFYLFFTKHYFNEFFSFSKINQIEDEQKVSEELKSQISQLNSDNESLNRDLTDKINMIDSLTNNINELKSMLNQSDKDIETFKLDIEERIKENNSLVSIKSDLEEKINHLNRNVVEKVNFYKRRKFLKKIYYII